MKQNPVTAANALTARWVETCSGGSVVMAGVGAWPLLAYLASAAGWVAEPEPWSADNGV